MPDLIPFSRKNCGRFFKLRCFPSVDSLWERLAVQATGDAILLGGEPVIQRLLPALAHQTILTAQESDAALIRASDRAAIPLDAFIADGGTVPYGIYPLDALNESAEIIDPLSISYVREIIVVVWGADRKDIARQFLKEPDTLPAGRLLANNAKVHVWLDAAAYPFAP